MGLSFHYKGKLKTAENLAGLIDEVEDICKVFGWKYTVFNSEFPNHTFTTPIDDFDYGILFIPTTCEPVSLVFDSEGWICSPIFKNLLKKKIEGGVKVITVKLNLDDANPIPEVSEVSEEFDPAEIIYSISVKTQFPDVESYVKLIELLRYLSGKYLTSFSMYDESEYWETENPEKIYQKLNKINHFMDTFQEMLESKSIKSPDDFITFIKQLSMQIKKKDDDHK